jgi:F-type H+-transporting ATPase subunit epsilon
MALHVELVSPDRVDFSGEAEMVIARTVDGDAAFLDGHIPFIGALAAAPLRVVASDGTETVFAVHQGFIEVSPPTESGTRVTILSDTSELASEIDVPRATAAKAAAEAALAADSEDADAAFSLRRASVRLSVASGQ